MEVKKSVYARAVMAYTRCDGFPRPTAYFGGA